MNKKEKVVCAAIYVMSVKDGYEGTRIVKGVNYEEIHNDGLVFEISHPTWCNMYIQGFATNKNRFVTPEKALEITGWGNQLRFRDRKRLLPEDLY